MTATPDKALDRLHRLGLELPPAQAPKYAYEPTTRFGDLLFVSGQISRAADGKIVTGTAGGSATLDEAIEAARICALNLLARLHSSVGLDNVAQVLKLNGYVASDPQFVDQPTVIDGASTLLREVLGAAGRHARTALAAPVLPASALVEIEAIVAVGDLNGNQRVAFH
ncbi:RidA family protein [Saccharopolyspora phatthalungensis]|uniref:Enamine deaminase RidA (YjgF/YER057c/UK114 family) n=1 Tax=Saccharopolyspora phatthalungensis TaxID=664693 RepID=A0A840Q8Q2_9PSEU|nr:RidA family protein [Saccharopolyspora phatthalungensis]MBB5156121.1 enamine deaminase RidA (YjgF/YER057c/UK114 family) [Saccharopolyspora phatthalungensis]